MATAAQVKALFESYKNGDDSRFKSIATQIAAHEANKGNAVFAKELSDIIQKFSNRIDNKVSALTTIPIIEPRGELSGLFEAKYSNIKLNHLILPPELSKKLKRIVEEQSQQQKLREHGLLPRSKILMIGAPGTGKTMTASALAGQLNFPLFIIQLDGLITKYMGEAAAKLRLIFDHIKKIRGLYLFDEFDAIGSKRDLTNDVGEIRRILNAFLQFIENSRSDSLILAATNHANLLDKALFRRFDDILRYENPDKNLIQETFKMYLTSEYSKNIDWVEIENEVKNISYAEIAKVCDNAIKNNVLDDMPVNTKLLLDFVREIETHRG
ncbi:putative AAA family ATPase [Candidatus Termititenax persephonae]|uniref:AAA family ATPase n=1 Tax=Candidatus Termititenax persephonae TaxID=2218525 RepID=A0A388THD5_9BACT|nr:putative AAA family ATPase [Candidatus Termititenax persephonae]